jgi:hypothetical protein
VSSIGTELKEGSAAASSSCVLSRSYYLVSKYAGSKEDIDLSVYVVEVFQRESFDRRVDVCKSLLATFS